jgi:cytoskeletal protein RodZ
MERRQQGFSIVEGLLILVIVGILGFTGWYVYHSQKNASNSYSNSVAGSSQTGTASKVSAKPANGCSLALSVGQKDGAAGTFHEDLVFTNKGSSNCTLDGYPTVTLLDSSGNKIGQAAGHDTAVSSAPVTVKPNESAYAGLSLPDPGVAGNCNSTVSAQIQAVVPALSATLKTTDTSDYYCPNFLVRPFQATPSI